MERVIAYPVLEGKIAERGIRKKTIAEALNISPRAFGMKMSGKTEFTWPEVEAIQGIFFKDISIDRLMKRA